MRDIADEVARAIRVTGARAGRSETLTSETVAAELRGRYAMRSAHGPLWESLGRSSSYRDRNAWCWIPEYVAGKPCVLAFNPDDEMAAFEFIDGSDLQAVLSAAFSFEFYLTDHACSFLLCHNHHDVLIACGSAAAFAEARRQFAGLRA